METRKAVALCSKLYKTEEEQQIFLCFRILKQEQKKQATKQNVFGFSNNNLNKTKQTKTRDLKKANKEKQHKYFWSFCVLENNNKARNYKKKERKTKHGYTKYRLSMIYK